MLNWLRRRRFVRRERRRLLVEADALESTAKKYRQDVQEMTRSAGLAYLPAARHPGGGKMAMIALEAAGCVPPGASGFPVLPIGPVLLAKAERLEREANWKREEAAGYHG